VLADDEVARAWKVEVYLDIPPYLWFDRFKFIGNGYVDVSQGIFIDKLFQALGCSTMMGRVGDPTEIAKTILFLADSDQSAFITGHAIIVDGGATIRLSTE